ncbi:Hypothetical predicted protein [Olea europaea subsp. europaea]|uniref:Uncharacterized protein n=1 Tax=Olea europaea subsp. europaea TaxID=158383 RepID=A0A8S0SFE7_OLEEU|nr:Hypothetical predicted protein [Olea europaea subsp. europaea]
MMSPLQRSVRDDVTIVVDAASACVIDFACVDLVVLTTMEVTGLGIFLLDGGCDMVEMAVRRLLWLTGGDGGEMRVGSCFGSVASEFGGGEEGGSNGRDRGRDGESILFTVFEITKLVVTGVVTSVGCRTLDAATSVGAATSIFLREAPVILQEARVCRQQAKNRPSWVMPQHLTIRWKKWWILAGSGCGDAVAIRVAGGGGGWCLNRRLWGWQQ